MVINIIGIKEAARLNIVLAILDLGTQVLLAIVGLFVFLSPKILITQIHLGVAPTWHQLIYGISIGTVAYTGIETISNMAEEASNPGRDVPRAVKFVLLAVLGVYFAISMVGLSAMTVHYNVLPVNPHDKGRSCRSPSSPRRASSAETGPWVLKSNPRAEGLRHRVTPTSSSYLRPRAAQGHRQDLPALTADGSRKLWGTQLATVYEADPLLGIVAEPAQGARSGSR